VSEENVLLVVPRARAVSLSLDSAESSRGDLAGRPLGKDCCLDSWVRLRGRPWACRQGKIGLEWSIRNSVSFLVIAACRASA